MVIKFVIINDFNFYINLNLVTITANNQKIDNHFQPINVDEWWSCFSDFFANKFQHYLKNSFT